MNQRPGVDLNNFFENVIVAYSRAMALDDGVLIDVSETAEEAGICFPVAITEAAWTDCVQWSDADTAEREVPQDESGRLWDVVWMMRLAVKANPDVETVTFSLYRVSRSGSSRTPQPVTLKAVIGPGDDGDPVITVMMPDED